MTRPTNRLTDLQIKNAADGKLQDGAGLILDKARGNWVWRYTFGGARREMGLGAWPAVTLAAARKARTMWAGVLASGKDPITERARQIADEVAIANRADPKLSEATETVFESIKATLRDGGARGRWMSPLNTHVLPKLGKRRMSSITAADIAGVLKPIWQTQSPTAEKAIQRLGIIFRKGKLMGYPCDPFTIEQARHILGDVIHKPQGIAHTHWKTAPALFARINSKTASHDCLRMMMLTMARAESVRGMCYSEIEGDVWTIPADRMKGRVGRVMPFRVPLPPIALDIIAERRKWAQNDMVFSYTRNAPLSETSLLKALNLLGEAGRPHGFRSTFREWVQDTNACPHDVAETVLAHQVGNAVERTYARSDLLDQRRIVLAKWADYLAAQSAVVVALRG